MKKVQPRKRYLTKKEYEEIHRLYWDEGWSQGDIALEFCGHSNNGSISRIINGPPPLSWEERRRQKSIALKNISLPKKEIKQAISLRQKRENHPSTKLTWKKASTIRHVYFQGMTSQTQLAKQYGVHQGTICKLLAGTRWKKTK